jgi:hypothetical protein
MKPWVFWVAALLLAASGTALVFDHARGDSATMDEPFHALASAEYAISGTYYANLEHPPLAKLLAGASLRLAGARPPRIPRPFAIERTEQPFPFTYGNTLAPKALLAAARRPFPFVHLLLVLVAAGAARAFGGDVAGLGAAALVAFEPNLIAHAGYLHTDAGAALLHTTTIVLCILALERRSYLAWAGCGLSLGLALAMKFSELFLVPVLLLLVLVAQLAETRTLGRPRDPVRALAALGVAVLVGLATLLATYATAMRHMPEPEAERAVRTYLSSRGATPAATERLLRISRVTPELGHYVSGLYGIALQNRAGGGVNFLRGRLSTGGFWDYFFVAFGVKSSLGLLAASAFALLLLLSRRTSVDLPLGCLLVAVITVFLPVMGTSYNIGVRHVLPAVPLLAIASAGVLSSALRASWAAAILVLLAAAQLVETARVHPHELSFFNALAGGPEHGAEWLNDSNLDWGQDLDRLCVELRARGWADGATVAYFGGGSVPDSCPEARYYEPGRSQLTPGIYAVSSYILTCAPELMAFRGRPDLAAGYEALRRAIAARGREVGRVGYSILIYRLEAEGRASTGARPRS